MQAFFKIPKRARTGSSVISQGHSRTTFSKKTTIFQILRACPLVVFHPQVFLAGGGGPPGPLGGGGIPLRRVGSGFENQPWLMVAGGDADTNVGGENAQEEVTKWTHLSAVLLGFLR